MGNAEAGQAQSSAPKGGVQPPPRSAPAAAASDSMAAAEDRFGEDSWSLGEDGFDGGSGGTDSAELSKIRAQQAKPRRISITAPRIKETEVSTYQKPVHHKDQRSRAEIEETLKNDSKMQVLMGHLTKETFDDVVNAFYMKDFQQGETIIRQGDDGNCLYILAEGSVEIFVARPGRDGAVRPGDVGTLVATWGAGALFGELALLYNAPRAATVMAAQRCRTWVLDAIDFKVLLMKSSQAQYQKYQGWLSQVSLLNALNHFELSRLADALEVEVFDAGEVIIQQGEEGDKFYILEDGSAAAYIQGPAGEKCVKTYDKVGDYFGEIALLRAEPRKATIRATGPGCSVASVSRKDFAALFGPITEQLQENVGSYPRYSDFNR